VKQNSGLTMVEMMVVLVVGAIVISGVYSLHSWLYKSVFASNRFTESEQGTYRKVDMICSALRRSVAVTSVSESQISMVLSGADSLTLNVRGDSLYRQENESQPVLWFTMDSCRFEFPLQDSGWVSAKVTGAFSGRQGKVHSISRTVCVQRQRPKVRDNEWGF